jgi:hypothetical protein
MNFKTLIKSYPIAIPGAALALIFLGLTLWRSGSIAELQTTLDQKEQDRVRL